MAKNKSEVIMIFDHDIAKYFKDQNKKTKILLLVSFLSLLFFFIIGSTLPFKDTMLSTLFPKPPSHAAYVFDDDFEQGLGIGSKWNSQVTESGVSISAADAAAYPGSTKGLRVALTGGDDARIYRNISPSQELFIRTRMKITNDLPYDFEQSFMGVANSNGTYRHSVQMRTRNGLVNRLYLSPGFIDTGVSLQPDTWYCIEMRIKAGDSTGRMTLWIDGNQIIDRQNLNLGASPFTGVALGTDGGPAGIEYYYDDYVVNDSNQNGCAGIIGKTGPIRTNGSPSGILSQNITSVLMSLNTNTNATCKYGETSEGIDANTSYASLPHTFETTGGTDHSSSISGLTPGTKRTYYVRCQDEQGIANDDAYAIAFSVGADSINVGEVNAVPNFESISVYASFSGDENKNGKVLLTWSDDGKSVDDPTKVWKRGMDLMEDRRTSVPEEFQFQFRGSLLGLTPNSSYHVRLTYDDPDGVVGTNPQILTVTTRDDDPPLGSGNTLFVGTNPQGGTSYTTIQQAVNAANAGDTIYIRGGTYKEHVIINKSGTQDNWITLLPYQDEEVIIDGENVRNNFTLTGSNYVRIKGLKLINGIDGAQIGKTGSNIMIDENIIEGFTRHAVNEGGDYSGAPSTASNITVQNNVITKTVASAYHIINFGSNSGGGFIIRKNQIRDITGVPRSSQYWDCISGYSNFAVTGFLHKDSDVSENYIEGCNDDTIEAEGGNINVRIWGNVVNSSTNGYNWFASAPTVVGPLYVFRNLAYGFSELKQGNAIGGNKYFYHNTVYGGNIIGKDGFKQTNPELGYIISRNNIISATRYAIEFNQGGSTHNFDYDNLYTLNQIIPDQSGVKRFVKWDDVQYSSLQSFRNATGQETHGFNIDPLTEWISTNSGDLSQDFHLKPNSQLIDKGEILYGFNDPDSKWPYQGAAPDLGAFEYGTSTPVPTPIISPNSTITPTPTLITTPTKTPTPTNTPAPTPTSTKTPTPTPISTPTLAPTFIPTPTPTPVPSQSSDQSSSSSGTSGSNSSSSTPESSALFPDLDKNGKINIFDLSILLRNWNKSGQGDLNSDGVVNIFDLSILLRNWSK